MGCGVRDPPNAKTIIEKKKNLSLQLLYETDQFSGKVERAPLRGRVCQYDVSSLRGSNQGVWMHIFMAVPIRLSVAMSDFGSQRYK
jgi:hypothetical protein